MARVKVDIIMPKEGKGLEAAKVRKHRAIVAAVDAGALIIRGAALKMILHGPKTGRVYLRDGIAHQASSPGEAPANDTGTLASSIQPDYAVDTTDRKETNVTARAEYAGFLEEGTTRMEKRPFMKRAFDENKSKIMAMIRKAFKS